MTARTGLLRGMGTPRSDEERQARHMRLFGEDAPATRGFGLGEGVGLGRGFGKGQGFGLGLLGSDESDKKGYGPLGIAPKGPLRQKIFEK